MENNKFDFDYNCYLAYCQASEIKPQDWNSLHKFEKLCQLLNIDTKPKHEVRDEN